MKIYGNSIPDLLHLQFRPQVERPNLQYLDCLGPQIIGRQHHTSAGILQNFLRIEDFVVTVKIYSTRCLAVCQCLKELVCLCYPTWR